MDGSAARAARLLEKIFAAVPVPMAFRLWDGHLVTAGAPGDAGFTIVLRTRGVLRRLLLRGGSTLAFGEAFIDGTIDIDGDFFAAMTAGQHVDDLHLTGGTRVAALWEALRP